MKHRTNRTLWDKRAGRYIQRGKTGLGVRVAREELICASELWNTHCENVTGWTVDFGSGSGCFWDLVTPPQRLLLTEISKLYTSGFPFRHRIVADANNPPIKDQSVECIVALGLIEYIPELDQFFIEMHRIAGESGFFLLSNSPPIIQNQLRSYIMPDVIPRRDKAVIKSLQNSGWVVPDEYHKRAGWQTLLIAKAN